MSFYVFLGPFCFSFLEVCMFYFPDSFQNVHVLASDPFYMSMFGGLRLA